MERGLSDHDIREMDINHKIVNRRSGKDRRKISTCLDPSVEKRKNVPDRRKK